MSSLEISSSCFNQETKLPLSPPLVEDSAFEPPGKDINEVEEKSKDIIKFTSEQLSVDEVSQLVISPFCGAISLFVGTTRNNFEGKKVISLEYEAYLPMAENEVRKICSDIRQKWPVKHIAVFHRLGLVPVSEASIIIAVSSAHRTASLEAVSYAIDTLKAKVPIWKKSCILMYEAYQIRLLVVVLQSAALMMCFTRTEMGQTEEGTWEFTCLQVMQRCLPIDHIVRSEPLHLVSKL